MPVGFFEQIGDYKIIERIGHGGMGDVWLANKCGFQGSISPCVVKRLHRDHCRDPKARELFINEARLAAQLNHPNIVKVVDAGEVEGQLYLVMDRVDGVNLNAYIKAVREARLPLPLDVDITCFIIGEVLTGLEYAHGRTIAGQDAGVVHFDITPNNILVSSSGSVQLTDFGLSRVAAHNPNVSFVAGTPRYMSIEHHTATPRLASDIYGLGVVLHELLTNTRYHDGLEPKQIRESILNGAIQPMPRDDLPAWLVQLRTQMLAGDYTQRPSARVALEIILRNVPGYRRASTEIANTYKAVVGEPRSGLTVFFNALPATHETFPLAIEGTARTGTVGSSPEISEVEEAPLLTEATEVLDGLDKPAVEPVVIDESPKVETQIEVPEPEIQPTVVPVLRPDRTPWWVSGGVAVAIVGLMGLGFSLATVAQSKDGDSEGEDVGNEETTTGGEPTTGVKAEVPLAKLAKASSNTLGLANVMGSSMRVAIEATIERLRKPVITAVIEPEPPPLTKVKVVLYIKGRSTGTIKIGSKEHQVNGAASTKLAPGSYAAKWRADAKDPWHDAGRIKVGNVAPNFYEFRLTDGAADRTEREPGKGK